MAIDSTQNVTSAYAQTAASSSSASKTLDMNAFLRMFTTQLKYQDPTNPLESYELASQLAQFSSVEKLTELNTNVQSQQALLSSINNAQMIGALGKEAVGVGNTLQVNGGVPSRGGYTLTGDADVTVKVYDAQDVLVRTIPAGQMTAGNHDVAWDGCDESGNRVADGSYRFDVSAVDAQGNSQDVTTTITGQVFSFRMEGGIPYLILNGSGGVMLPTSSVQEIHETV